MELSEPETEMREMIRAIIVAFGLAASALPVQADEANAIGIGYSPCTKLTEMYRTAPPQYGYQVIDSMVGSWIGGFETASNMFLSLDHQDTKNLGAMTMEQQIIQVRKYCKKHPDDQVMIGVADLFRTLPSMADGQ
jgi:hypothetical protein